MSLTRRCNSDTGLQTPDLRLSGIRPFHNEKEFLSFSLDPFLQRSIGGDDSPSLSCIPPDVGTLSSRSVLCLKSIV